MDKEKIGRMLRELRGDKTQKEVADAVGVTAMAISQYEQGERIPQDEIKVKLAKFFNKSIEDIFFNNKVIS